MAGKNSRKRAMKPTQPTIGIQPPVKVQMSLVSQQSENVPGTQTTENNPVAIVAAVDNEESSAVVEEEKALARHKRVMVVLPRIRILCKSKVVGKFFKNIVDMMGTLLPLEQDWFQQSFGINPQFAYVRWKELSKPLPLELETPRETFARLLTPVFAGSRGDIVPLYDDLRPLYEKIMTCFETHEADVFADQMKLAMINLDNAHIITLGQILGIDIFKLKGWFRKLYFCSRCPHPDVNAPIVSNASSI